MPINAAGPFCTYLFRTCWSRQFVAAVVALLAVLGQASAYAQAWPSRQVRVVLPFAAGGSTDVIARTLGQKLSDSLGQSVVIDNRPGAAGAIATDHVAKSPADGYTLLMATTSTHSVLPVLNPKLSFDASRDFALVGLVARAPNVLIASPMPPAARRTNSPGWC
jgi:tripartite-type tricarboxylate transporter receptor subunit TctC